MELKALSHQNKKLLTMEIINHKLDIDIRKTEIKIEVGWSKVYSNRVVNTVFTINCPYWLIAALPFLPI
ncbi:hypothetical protein BCT94_05755 [Vibrio breoganii]|nr:hypothetical protein BCT94_05755 [Vibrio breoganii]